MPLLITYFQLKLTQNLHLDFSETKTYYSSIKKKIDTYLTKNVFVHTVKNGKKIPSKYLCYSPSKKAIFRIPCSLFSDGTSNLETCGYTDWNKVHAMLIKRLLNMLQVKDHSQLRVKQLVELIQGSV